MKIILVGLVLLNGCMGPLVNIRETNTDITNKIQSYTDKQILQDKNITILGTVNATSCKHLMWEPDASLDNCTAQLKMRAADLGANGLVLGGSEKNSVNFLPSKGINRNCWNTIDCTGIAIIKKSNLTKN